MHFHANIVVQQPLETVSAFFEDPHNLAKWDRSVARVEPLSPGPPAAGFRFDTIAPGGMRMSYRITEHDSQRGSTIELLSSNMFKAATWTISYDALPSGTRVTCEVDFILRPRSCFLVVPLMLTGRKSLVRDLTYLKDAIEHSDVISDRRTSG